MIPKDYKTIIVLGMHKGGTSMVANTLHQGGIPMYDESVPTDEINQAGYFEDIHFTELNEEMLKAMGGSVERSWYNPPESDIRKVEFLFREKAEKILKEHAKPLWGAKDPRFAFTFPLYAPFFEREPNGKRNVYFVIVQRNKDANVKSLLATHAHQVPEPSIEFFADLYEKYHEKARETSWGYNTIVVDYDKLVNHSLDEMQKLEEFVGMPFRDDGFGAVNPSLRHYG